MQICFPYSLRFKQIIEKLKYSDPNISIICTNSNTINFMSMSPDKGLVIISLSKDIDNAKNLMNFNCSSQKIEKIYFNIFDMCRILSKSKENYLNHIVMNYNPIRDPKKLSFEFISSCTSSFNKKIIEDEFLYLSQPQLQTKYNWSKISQFDSQQSHVVYLNADEFIRILKSFWILSPPIPNTQNTNQIIITVESRMIKFKSEHGEIEYTLYHNHDNEKDYEEDHSDISCEKKFFPYVTIKMMNKKKPKIKLNQNQSLNDDITREIKLNINPDSNLPDNDTQTNIHVQRHMLSQLLSCEKPCINIHRVTLFLMPVANIMVVKFKIDNYGDVQYYFGTDIITLNQNEPNK